MNEALPPVISRFLTTLNSGDADALIACFTNDANLTDEDQTWHGHTEIQRWQQEVARAFKFTVEILGAAKQPSDEFERHDLNVRLEGDFPGGIVDLTYRFGLRGGLIAELEMTPVSL
jgi:ketosteroid isomerase-like protein